MTQQILKITMTGPSDVVAQSLDAFARHHGWSEGSDKTPLQFSEHVIFSMILRDVRQYSVSVATAEAARQAASAIEALVPLTTFSVSLQEGQESNDR